MSYSLAYWVISNRLVLAQDGVASSILRSSSDISNHLTESYFYMEQRSSKGSLGSQGWNSFRCCLPVISHLTQKHI
jgi:hypothetical protein